MNEQALTDVQIRLAFQEDLLSALDCRIAEQQAQIEVLSTQLRHLSKKLKSLEGEGRHELSSEETPPHY